jgi:hypothetical protein
MWEGMEHEERGGREGGGRGEGSYSKFEVVNISRLTEKVQQ